MTLKENLRFIFKGSLTVPNLLTVIRIILVPVFGVCFYRERLLAAVIVLVISGLTDLFDGKIARRFNQVSELGKIMDPIADKLTQMMIGVVLFLKFSESKNSAMVWFKWVFLVFIVKELLMLLVGSLLIALGLRPDPAKIWGKLATVVFYAVMVVVFAFGPEVGAFRSWFELPDSVMIMLVGLSAALTVAALLGYVPATLRQFRERKRNDPKKEAN